MLRRTHVEVEYVLLRGAKPVDRHQWGVTAGDPKLLAEAVDRPESHTSYLLGVAGSPVEVIAHAVQALGLPQEVPGLLDGAPATGQRVESRGILGGVRASVRGDFAPPEGTGHALDRYMRLSRTRPRWFRAVNAAAAVVYGLVVWGLVMWGEGLPDWRFVLFAVLCGLGLANALWDTRPPRRPKDDAPEALRREPTPTG
ncbi:hypothetical protein [Blastococcus brunescens]|uniref:Uncharacterized protein n=1 Tax=Blastococcus brunescens TaxID=1564165 RepID=A0ABZ1AVP8_9ACTN|nr:hypothetical protein [Blastococcus sp. BMG 8361]WRL62640.1 hypothetical protein U6N30_22215 [Blastococcus sp. BMG 8361]